MRRGQIEFGESLMVVIVLAFILIIGIVFYFNVSQRALGKEISYRESVEAATLARSVAAMPEVRCEALAGDCVDKLKVEALGGMLIEGPNDDDKARKVYGDLFEYATIKLHVVATDGLPEEILVYHERPSRNLTETRQMLFVSLLDPVSGEKRVAYFNVTKYVPEARS